MSNVRRVYVEKKPAYAVQAKELKHEISSYLGIKSATNVRVLIRYDVENISDEVFEKACRTVFAEPPVDDLYLEKFEAAEGAKIFSVEYLPGQFDQRADSAVQCVQFLDGDAQPIIRSATTYVIEGNVTDEEFINTFEVNTFGPFKFIREVIPYMKEKGGAIINTSSLAGTYGSKMQAAYSASKFAINGLTKSCAKELGAYNIRVNAVAPGAVMTNITKGVVNASNAEIFKEIGQGMKLAKPEELAGAYVYLASDEASFTTGAILAVDGGSIM